MRIYVGGVLRDSHKDRISKFRISFVIVPLLDVALRHEKHFIFSCRFYFYVKFKVISRIGITGILTTSHIRTGFKCKSIIDNKIFRFNTSGNR